VAVFLNNNIGVKINDVDLSDHVSAVNLVRKFDELEVSAMGDTAHRFVKGLEASSVQIDFFNDTATANVLATLQASWGTTVTLKLLQVKGAAVSATNPLYTMPILINNTTDINGNVSELSTQSITFTVNGASVVSNTGTF
jgi:hypothetical protein